MITRISLASSLLLLAACQQPMRLSHVMTGHARAPHPGGVRLHMEAEPVPEGFREIAIVQAITYGREADLAHVVRGLRERSAALGCTAIVRVHIDQGSTTASGNGVCGVFE
jgi:hypothetical protein